MRDRVLAIGNLWPITLLAGMVLGGIYTGMFTPTEAGAAGALGTLVLGAKFGQLRSFTAIKESLRESAHTSSMLFFIIVTALFFSRFLAISRIPMHLTAFIETWQVPPFVILASVLMLWFVLGMIIVQAAVFALTLPIVFPIIVSLGYDPVWFCVIAMKLNEIAGVTPPVGLNAYALKGVAGKDTTIEDVFVGVWPFVL